MSAVTAAVDLSTVIAATRPIGLAALLDRASLQDRVDRKYVLTLEEAAALVTALDEWASVLEIDGVRTFGYSSVYLDTADLRSYRLAAHRRPRRFKVRTRTYTDSAQCWLEVKTRDRRGRTLKQRTAYDPRDAGRLTPDGRDFAAAVLHDAGFGRTDPGLLHAALVTGYRRSTLHLAGDESRLTLDTELTCTLPGSGSALLAGAVVVETKTAGRACAADHLLWRAGHRPLRLSKYGTGLAALRPDLPGTPWRPVLARHPFTTDWSSS